MIESRSRESNHYQDTARTSFRVPSNFEPTIAFPILTMTNDNHETKWKLRGRNCRSLKPSYKTVSAERNDRCPLSSKRVTQNVPACFNIIVARSYTRT